MTEKEFSRMEENSPPYYNFSDEKFMFKRTWQVVFWGRRNYFRHPKTNLPARLKARDGLHSEVVAPESGKTGTKIGKMTYVIYRPSLKNDRY